MRKYIDILNESILNGFVKDEISEGVEPMRQGEFKVIPFSEGRHSRATLQDKLNQLREEGYHIMNVNTLSYKQINTDENHGHGYYVEAQYQIICHKIEE